MRSSRFMIGVAIGAVVWMSGCRDLLGIGGDDSTDAPNDGGGSDGNASLDGAAMSSADGSPMNDAALTTDSGTDGAAQEAGAVNVDARYAAWKPAPDTPTQLSTQSGGTVVVDAVTGLWWEQTNTQSTSMLSRAQSYCASITTGGHNDWRVPTRVELVSIIDFNDSSLRRPAIFGAPASSQWTQSQVVGDATQVYVVDFVNDATGSLLSSAAPSALSGIVRCVRNGRPLPASPTSPLPSGLWVQQGSYMYNTLTKQTWEKTPSSMPSNYANAMQRCASLGAGFRVPTMRELDTLTDESRLGAPVWPATFDGTQAYYWSSTAEDGTYNFTWSSAGRFSVTETFRTDVYVRCVSP